MIEWFTNLPLEFQVFYGIGIFALAVVIVQMTMTLIGFDHDGGFDVELGDINTQKSDQGRMTKRCSCLTPCKPLMFV